MLLSNLDRERITENFSLYDLVEELDITVEEFIDAFDFKIIENLVIMERIGYDEEDQI